MSKSKRQICSSELPLLPTKSISPESQVRLLTSAPADASATLSAAAFCEWTITVTCKPSRGLIAACCDHWSTRIASRLHLHYKTSCGSDLQRRLSSKPSAQEPCTQSLGKDPHTVMLSQGSFEAVDTQPDIGSCAADQGVNKTKF